MKRLTLIVFFLIWLPVAQVLAANLANLYEVRMPVTSQQEDDRTAAVHDGMLLVLVRLSGDTDIANKPAIKKALKRADYYVQEYSYEPVNATEANYFLRVKFDKRDMQRLLKRSSVAYWGDKRPLILVWMAVSDLNQDYKVIGSEDASDLLTSLKKESKKYGLPIIFPMMDMTDMTLAATEDVTDMNVSSLDAASKRYSPDALLIGRVIDNKQDYTCQWILVRNGNSWEWAFSESNPDTMFATLMSEVRQVLSKQLSLRFDGPSQTQLKLTVTNVTKPDDFEHLVAFLKQLVPVKDVQLSEVTGDVVDLDVQVQGTIASFQENNLLNQRLTLMSRDEASNTLTYEWKR